MFKFLPKNIHKKNKKHQNLFVLSRNNICFHDLMLQHLKITDYLSICFYGQVTKSNKTRLL